MFDNFDKVYISSMLLFFICISIICLLGFKDTQFFLAFFLGFICAFSVVIFSNFIVKIFDFDEDLKEGKSETIQK